MWYDGDYVVDYFQFFDRMDFPFQATTRNSTTSAIMALLSVVPRP